VSVLKKTENLIKILITNILVFFTAILLVELFFGYWFKNKLENKLSSERNIYRIYVTNFKYLNNSSLPEASSFTPPNFVSIIIVLESLIILLVN